MSKPGLYANIHAKKARIKAGSGETMRKVGKTLMSICITCQHECHCSNSGSCCGGECHCNCCEHELKSDI